MPPLWNIVVSKFLLRKKKCVTDKLLINLPSTQARIHCWSKDDETHVKHADIWVKHPVYRTAPPNHMYDQREESSNVLEDDVPAVPSRSDEKHKNSNVMWSLAKHCHVNYMSVFENIIGYVSNLVVIFWVSLKISFPLQLGWRYLQIFQVVPNICSTLCNFPWKR